MKRRNIFCVHYKNNNQNGMGQNLFHHDFYDYYIYLSPERENAKFTSIEVNFNAL